MDTFIQRKCGVGQSLSCGVLSVFLTSLAVIASIANAVAEEPAGKNSRTGTGRAAAIEPSPAAAHRTPDTISTALGATLREEDARFSSKKSDAVGRRIGQACGRGIRSR